MPLRRANVALPSLFWKAQQSSIDKSYWYVWRHTGQVDCSSRKCFSISSNIHGNAQKHLVYCNTWRKLSNRGWGGFAWKSCLSHRLIVRVKAKTCCVRTDCAAHMIDFVFQVNNDIGLSGWKAFCLTMSERGMEQRSTFSLTRQQQHVAF